MFDSIRRWFYSKARPSSQQAFCTSSCNVDVLCRKKRPQQPSYPVFAHVREEKRYRMHSKRRQHFRSVRTHSSDVEDSPFIRPMHDSALMSPGTAPLQNASRKSARGSETRQGRQFVTAESERARSNISLTKSEPELERTALCPVRNVTRPTKQFQATMKISAAQLASRKPERALLS